MLEDKEEKSPAKGRQKGVREKEERSEIGKKPRERGTKEQEPTKEKTWRTRRDRSARKDEKDV